MIFRVFFAMAVMMAYSIFNSLELDDSQCYRAKYNVTAKGSIVSVFKNTDLDSCCQYCYKISECVVSLWENDGSDEGECYLYKNVTALWTEKKSESIMQTSSQKAPYNCTTVNDRLYYELIWTKIDGITGVNDCIERCTLDLNCKSWAYEKLKTTCLTTTTLFNSSKWTPNIGMTTGACILNF